MGPKIFLLITVLWTTITSGQNVQDSVSQDWIEYSVDLCSVHLDSLVSLKISKTQVLIVNGDDTTVDLETYNLENIGAVTIEYYREKPRFSVALINSNSMSICDSVQCIEIPVLINNYILIFTLAKIKKGRRQEISAEYNDYLIDVNRCLNKTAFKQSDLLNFRLDKIEESDSG